MSDRPDISIVTPSFRGGRWLPLCIASVADQSVHQEHIVQDAGSDDGTLDWLAKDTRVRAFVEKDQGMYDAVNRGFRRAKAEIVAYLNCDEQYLPDALSQVIAFFNRHPEVDILFGDCLVVDATGEYICERRSLTPRLIHTWTASNLSFLTAATFLRRRVLDAHQLWFNADYRDAGDQDWALRVIQAGIRTAVLPQFLSVFTETGANMNLGENASRERRDFHASAPIWTRWLSPFALVHHRLRRWRAGHYRGRPHDYAIYTQSSPPKRITFHVTNPTYRWRRGPAHVPRMMDVIATACESGGTARAASRSPRAAAQPFGYGHCHRRCSIPPAMARAAFSQRENGYQDAVLYTARAATYFARLAVAEDGHTPHPERQT